jgi:hypothetical protein
MADTNTPNILLLLPDLADPFSFGTHVENNFTTVDSMMGAVQCTSTTRPSNTYAGQIVYETDSHRYAQNVGSKASPVWAYTSHTPLVVTSATRPTVGRTAGLLIFETDTSRILIWDGAAWQPLVRSSQIINFTASVTSNQTFTTGTETDLTGCTTTFATTHTNAVCSVTASLDVQVNTPAGTFFLAVLTVDGVDQSQQVVFEIDTANSRQPCGQVWQFTLSAAGSHTVKMRANLSSGSGSATVNATHSHFAGTCYDF